jgi:hypothetical protein
LPGQDIGRLFRIQINSDLLRAHLAQENGKPVTFAAIREDLFAAGFCPDGAGWMVIEKNLGYLQSSEVESVEVIADGLEKKRWFPDES